MSGFAYKGFIHSLRSFNISFSSIAFNGSVTSEHAIGCSWVLLIRTFRLCLRYIRGSCMNVNGKVFLHNVPAYVFVFILLTC